MPSKYRKKQAKQTNNKKVKNFSWTHYAEKYQPPHSYSREFPIKPQINQADLGTVLNEKVRIPFLSRIPSL